MVDPEDSRSPAERRPARALPSLSSAETAAGFLTWSRAPVNLRRGVDHRAVEPGATSGQVGDDLGHRDPRTTARFYTTLAMLPERPRG
ncbi:hypothetical protein [Pyxidicoccus fallax]|uniref:hypothetical protein n=1 Tax=Pyxidicoccus fallax TaxID=394095 RepID=UPI00149466E5|nr:hypothetical protein [Pyxidicoccus fallax]